MLHYIYLITEKAKKTQKTDRPPAIILVVEGSIGLLLPYIPLAAALAFSFSVVLLLCVALSSFRPLALRLIGLSDGGFGSEGRVVLDWGALGVTSSMMWAHTFNILECESFVSLND